MCLKTHPLEPEKLGGVEVDCAAGDLGTLEARYAVGQHDAEADCAAAELGVAKADYAASATRTDAICECSPQHAKPQDFKSSVPRPVPRLRRGLTFGADLWIRDSPGDQDVVRLCGS